MDLRIGVSRFALSDPIKGKSFMAQNHYVTKTKRRVKNAKRKDPSAATMAKLRKLAAADKK